MLVVFSTYQSIQVISDAQLKYDLPEFDLIICDEAHRTIGAKFKDKEESFFIRIHYQKFVKGKDGKGIARLLRRSLDVQLLWY